ncbi:MAG: hypothetical protein QG597_2552, partial [Actinomycetota bacterium]|nr:hypothetical protein [Actinomycetota bacterium]
MWMWIVILLAIIAAISVGIRQLRHRGRANHPEPAFATRPGAFRALALGTGVLDPGRAELALRDGTSVVWDPPVLTLGVGLGPENTTASPGSSDWRDALWVAAPEAGLLGVAVADTVRSQLLLDDSVLAALSQLSGTQVDGLADLRSVMDWKDYQLDSVKIQGTVAEQVAGEDFAAAGHNVEFPQASNNPGWDFTIDGQEVNSKLTVDYDNVANAHFSEYPDIPVVINADAANIPTDAIYFDGTPLDPADIIGDNIVIVDESLSLSGVNDILSDTGVAADGVELDDGGIVPGLSLVIAAVRSSYREGKLLNKGKTDWGRAAKNVAVDTGAKGGGALAGGLAGAKTGALIDLATGGATFGLGALTGGLIGAVAGGLIGGKVAESVKLKPLYDAQDGLERRLRQLDSSIHEAQEIANARLDDALQDKQAQFDRSAALAHEEFQLGLEAGRREITRVSLLSPEETRALLDAGHDLVQAERDAFKSTFDQRPWIDRTLNRDALERVDRAADAWNRGAELEREISSPSAQATEGAFDLVMALPGGRRAAEAFLHRIEATRVEARAAATSANDSLVHTIVAMRAASVAALELDAQQISEEAQDAIKPQIDKVAKAKDKVL